MIGVHKEENLEKKLNVGTFINVIFDKIDNTKIIRKDKGNRNTHYRQIFMLN